MITNRGVTPKEDRDAERSRRDESLLLKVGKYAAIGFEFNGTLLGGVLLGYLLDRYLNTAPWFLVSVSLLALVGAFVRLVQWLRRFSGEGKGA